MLTIPVFSRCRLQQSYVLFAVLIALALFAAPVWSQGVGTTAPADYSNFLTTFLNTTANWANAVRPLAQRTFWALAFLELNIAFWPLALQGATLGEFSWAMVKLILFLGFFYALVLSGGEWMQDIVDSFSQAGAVAGGAKTALNPPNVLFQGLTIGNTLLENASFWHPLNNVGLEISALIIVILFGVIAAILGLLLLESYITLGAATFLFAFGGCRFTSDYARHAFQASIVIGAKLFIIQLMVATASPLFNSWVAAFHKDNANVLGLIGLTTIYCLACAMVPSIVNRLMGGAGSGGALGTVMGAAGLAVGAGAALGAASKLAGAQVAGAAGGAAEAAVEGSAAASLNSVATSAPGGLPNAVASMPGGSSGGGIGGDNPSWAGGSTGGHTSSPRVPESAFPIGAYRGSDPDAVLARLEKRAEGGNSSGSTGTGAASPAKGDATGSAADTLGGANDNAASAGAGTTIEGAGAASSATDGPAAGSASDTLGAASDNAASAATGSAADTLSGGNDNGTAATTGTAEGAAASRRGAGAAGEHAARTLGNFASHVLKHADSSNPFKAAASEMDSKAAALSGAGQPSAPLSEPPMATAGGTISGGARLDPEQPLSGDKPDDAAGSASSSAQASMGPLPTSEPGASVPPSMDTSRSPAPAPPAPPSSSADDTGAA